MEIILKHNLMSFLQQTPIKWAQTWAYLDFNIVPSPGELQQGVAYICDGILLFVFFFF